MFHHKKVFLDAIPSLGSDGGEGRGGNQFKRKLVTAKNWLVGLGRLYQKKDQFFID